MIRVRLCGGLGNQMFQYACALALAERLNTHLILDVQVFKGDELRKFALDQWQIPEDQKSAATKRPRSFDFFASKYSYPNKTTGLTRRLETLFHHFPRPRRLHYSRVIEKQSGHYQKIVRVDSSKTRIFLSGYWQSEKYFKGMEERILSIFKPSQPLSNEDKTLASEMRRNSASVSVHVRCRDYLDNFETWKLHYVCTPGYYQDAFNLIRKKLSPQKPHLYIFSDDPEWVKSNVEIPYWHRFVSNGKRIESHEITLMSKCRHHIIANSSFSWWGAWLNCDEMKTVIAPPRWFNNANSSPDIIPKRWTKCPENEDGDQDYVNRP